MIRDDRQGFHGGTRRLAAYLALYPKMGRQILGRPQRPFPGDAGQVDTAVGIKFSDIFQDGPDIGPFRQPFGQKIRADRFRRSEQQCFDDPRFLHKVEHRIFNVIRSNVARIGITGAGFVGLGVFCNRFRWIDHLALHGVG